MAASRDWRLPENIDVSGSIDRLCDDAGLDNMETEPSVGVGIEAGLPSFGDAGVVGARPDDGGKP